MKLYSGPLSLFTSKVRIALAEKKIEYERIEVGWSLEDRYLPHHPDVVRLNPRRQVPVLVDGDAVVYDSTQILEYLEDRYPEPPLYPRDPVLRARCRRLEADADELIFPHVWSLIETAFYASAAADVARARAAREGIAALHATLEGELGGADYLCGEFSVADIATFVMTSAAAALGAPPKDAHPALTAWLQRLRARPDTGAEAAAMAKVAAEAFAKRA